MKYNSVYLLLICLLLQNCGQPEKDSQNTINVNDVIPVRLQELKITSSEMVIECSGQFTTDDETHLAFKTGGIIERILVREGDAVRAGQLLARLNPTEIEAQVGQAHLALDKAKRDFMRAENLFRDSVVTLEQYQNARTAMEFAERQLTAAEFNRSFSEIRALRNGYILKKLVNEGQVVGPGNPVLVTNGAGRKQWLFKTGVSDLEWAAVQTGDPATITCDAMPGRKFEARVSNKSAGADPGSGTLAIELRLINPEGFASGIFGNAVIRTTRKQPSWNIPFEALLDGNAKSGFVFVTEDKKSVKKIPVVVESIGKNSLVISAGLDGYRYLVVSGSPYLKDGSPISAE